MIPKKAIERAIEGGWKLPYIGEVAVSFDAEEDGLWTYPKEGVGEFRKWKIIALDSTFWQSLGRALGWPEDWYMGRTELRDDVEGKLWKRGCPSYNAHEFYDLILTNGDTTAFWEDLLT